MTACFHLPNLIPAAWIWNGWAVGIDRYEEVVCQPFAGIGFASDPSIHRLSYTFTAQVGMVLF